MNWSYLKKKTKKILLKKSTLFFLSFLFIAPTFAWKKTYAPYETAIICSKNDDYFLDNTHYFSFSYIESIDNPPREDIFFSPKLTDKDSNVATYQTANGKKRFILKHTGLCDDHGKNYAFHTFEIAANTRFSQKVSLCFTFEDASFFIKNLACHSVHAIDALKVLIGRYYDCTLVFKPFSFNPIYTTVTYQVFYRDNKTLIQTTGNDHNEPFFMTFFYAFN